MNTNIIAREAVPTIADSFLKSLSLLEQAHRRLHDVVKDDLERSVSVTSPGFKHFLSTRLGKQKHRRLRCVPEVPLLVQAFLIM